MRKLLFVSTTIAFVLIIPAVSSEAMPNPPSTDPATVPLNIQWRVKVNRPDHNTDYMTTIIPSERDQYPSEGAVFYVPANGTTPNTAILYRERNDSIPDHMDSEIYNEDGYTTEGGVGYPWTLSGAVPGLTELMRAWNPNTYDQVTIQPNQYPSGYCCAGGFTKWGYARYYQQSESTVSLNGGGITIQSNAVAGGSIWRWTWNNKQFVNHYDLGREIQSALFFNGITNNPTEAGDQYSGQNAIPEDRHGSPMASPIANNGTKQSTTSIPLEWNPQNFGGSSSKPVVYPNVQLGKVIALNWNNMGTVAQYVTNLTLPSSVNNAQITIPSGYFNGSFNKFFTYDAPSQTTTQVSPPLNCPGNSNVEFQNFTYGGVIIADGTGSTANAIGVFGKNSSIGGSISYFTLWNFLCGGGTGETDTATSKWDAVYGPATIGTSTYKTWVISDTLANVKQQMHNVYLYLTSGTSTKGEGLEASPRLKLCQGLGTNCTDYPIAP